MTRATMILLAALTLTLPASAGLTITIPGPVLSDGPFGEPGNGVVTFDYAGPAFTPDQLTFAGEVTSGGIGSFLNELQVWLTDPAGNTVGWYPMWGRAWDGVQTIAPNVVGSARGLLFGVPGTWTVTFSECFDEPGVDAVWSNVEIALADAAVPQITRSGNTTNGPTWRRPHADLNKRGYYSYMGRSTHYHALAPTVDTAGAYTIRSTQDGWNGVLFLYVNAVVPPTTSAVPNAVAGNDDGPNGMGTSELTAALTPGTPYYVVVTGFADDEFGAYTVSADGPGQITLLLPTCRGDTNCDGAINWRDIDFLLAAMTSEAEWVGLFTGDRTCGYSNCDANADTAVDWLDINPFIALMNTTCP